MAIDRETIVSLHKKGKSNSTIAMKLQIRRETVWKLVKKFRETGQTSNRPDQDRKRSVRTKRMVKNTREKLRTKPRRQETKPVAEAGINQTLKSRILKKDIKTFPYKMQKRHELTPTHERMSVERCRHLLSLMEDGMLRNLVFSDEKKFDVEQCVNHQNDRVWGRNASVEGRRESLRQNPTSVMVWAAVTATGRSLLVFVPSGVYISDILEGELLPWVREYFEEAPCTFQQDSAPSHGSRMTQRWIQSHIPAFISKEDWSSRSLDLNPLNFSVWSILESKACRTSHDSLENLKGKLQREWALILQEDLCGSCNAFQGRLKQIINNKGSHIG